MEQKRTLWIILASGIFLLVVLGTALGLYASEVKRMRESKIQLASKEEKTEKTLQKEDFNSFDESQNSVEFVYETDENPAIISGIISPEEGKTELTDAAEDEKTISTDILTVIAKGPTTIYGYSKNYSEDETVIDLNYANSRNQSEYDSIESITANNSKAQKKIDETNKTRKRTETVEPVVEKTAAKIEPLGTKTVKPAEKKEVKTTSTTTQKKTQTVSRENASAKIVQAAPVKIEDKFWVQVASYTTKKMADQARVALDAQKIDVEVFTYTEKNTTYYRVRAGSYTTKSEAEYWKNQIEKIDAFKDAKPYVVNSSAKAR